MHNASMTFQVPASVPVGVAGNTGPAVFHRAAHWLKAEPEAILLHVTRITALNARVGRTHWSAPQTLRKANGSGTLPLPQRSDAPNRAFLAPRSAADNFARNASGLPSFRLLIPQCLRREDARGRPGRVQGGYKGDQQREDRDPDAVGQAGREGNIVDRVNLR